jgi:YD repeat-containing protein
VNVFLHPNASNGVGASCPSTSEYYQVEKWTPLKSVTETSDGVSSTTLFTYNTVNFALASKKMTTSTTDTLLTEYKYAFQNGPLTTDMTTRNMLNAVYEEVSSRIKGNAVMKLNTARHNSQKITNRIVPQSELSAVGTSVLEEDLRYTQYDARFNPTEFVSRNTITTSIAYYTGIGKKNLPQSKSEASNTIISLQSTYDYIPLKGVQKITNPNGSFQTFNYDGLGRLVETFMNTNKTKSFSYNIKTGCSL